MIAVDKIKFQFLMADQEFARGLYEHWDSFCKMCVTDILDEELSSYDSSTTDIEIDGLRLDLGGIAQEDFYEAFPIRLRRELRRLLSLSPQLTVHNSQSTTPRLNEGRAEFVGAIPSMKDEERSSTHNLQPITHWLLSPTLSRREKIEILSKSLQESPTVVLAFIHSYSDISLLTALSDLLESPSVRHIIYAESQSHTEVGVPAYWFSLHEWLYKYYPWGGVAIFGDKASFGKYLNIKLLTFINKRADGAYLTKGELTIQFILEVFGSDHYLEVLRVIYYNQTLDNDSRPIAGDYYTWEIYYILLKHSIITPHKRDVQGDLSTESLSASTSISPSRLSGSLQEIQDLIGEKHNSSLKQVVEIIDETKLLYLLSSNCSYRIVSIVEKLLSYALPHRDTLDKDYYLTIIEWLRSLVTSTTYIEPSLVAVQKLLNRLQKFIPSLDIEELLPLFDSEDMIKIKSLKEICITLTHTEHSLGDRQRIYINLLSRYAEVELLIALEESKLLDDFVQTLPHEIIRVLMLRLAQHRDSITRNIVDWIFTNCDAISNVLGYSTPTLLRRMILLFREWSEGGNGINSDEATSLREFIRGIILNKGDEKRVRSRFMKLCRTTNARMFNLMLQLEECDANYLEDIIATQGCTNIVEWIRSEQVKDVHTAILAKHYINTYSHRFLAQLKPLSKREAAALVDEFTIEREDIISCAKAVDIYLAITLCDVAKMAEESASRWGLFSGSSRELSASLSGAMLLLLIEIHESGRSVDREYIISRFFSLWCFILTGEEQKEGSSVWHSAMAEVMDSNIGQSKEQSVEELGGEYGRLSPDNFDKLSKEVIYEDNIEIEPQYISTSSAGLAILSPWFARLFGMLGLLDKENRRFKSEEAKIRGVFILQRLSTPEQRRWRDSELAFNRILVGLPFSTPLPAELELYKEEVEAIESMLKGVKANWKVLANTSMHGFQSSFIARKGRIERRKSSWRVHVEPRSYDMLLDSLPWSYTPIRLPWLKEWIDIIWRETQEFDY